MGDVWPVPGGGEAASLLGTSPEQRKRSIASGPRGPEASGCLRFPPLWETSVWRVMCGVWCVACGVVCDVWCVVCGVCCVVVCCVMWCVVFCVCVPVPARRRCAIQNENPISRSIGKKEYAEDVCVHRRYSKLIHDVQHNPLCSEELTSTSVHTLEDVGVHNT